MTLLMSLFTNRCSPQVLQVAVGELDVEVAAGLQGQVEVFPQHHHGNRRELEPERERPEEELTQREVEDGREFEPERGPTSRLRQHTF